jgi:rapamycin-insensitive companion of mTOR
MGTKDNSKWNYDILLSLIEGPMLNPKRFEEAFRVSKFGRRIMAFFHPFSRRFADMKNTKVCFLGLFKRDDV